MSDSIGENHGHPDGSFQKKELSLLHGMKYPLLPADLSKRQDAELTSAAKRLDDGKAMVMGQSGIFLEILKKEISLDQCIKQDAFAFLESNILENADIIQASPALMKACFERITASDDALIAAGIGLDPEIGELHAKIMCGEYDFDYRKAFGFIDLCLKLINDSNTKPYMQVCESIRLGNKDEAYDIMRSRFAAPRYAQIAKLEGVRKLVAEVGGDRFFGFRIFFERMGVQRLAFQKFASSEFFKDLLEIPDPHIRIMNTWLERREGLSPDRLVEELLVSGISRRDISVYFTAASRMSEFSSSSQERKAFFSQVADAVPSLVEGAYGQGSGDYQASSLSAGSEEEKPSGVSGDEDDYLPDEPEEIDEDELRYLADYEFHPIRNRGSKARKIGRSKFELELEDGTTLEGNASQLMNIIEFSELMEELGLGRIVPLIFMHEKEGEVIRQRLRELGFTGAVDMSEKITGENLLKLLNEILKMLEIGATFDLSAKDFNPIKYMKSRQYFTSKTAIKEILKKKKVSAKSVKPLKKDMFTQ